MAETIIDRMAKHDPRRAAKRNYLELLRQQGSAADDQQDKNLSIVAHVLGRTPAQVKADAQVVGQLIQLEKTAGRRTTAEAEAKSAAATAQRHADETAQIVADRERAYGVLSGNAAVARSVAVEAANAELQAQQLRNANADLLADA